jgi:hypothetical protein
MEQILIAFKIYKFTNIDEAIQIMIKDTEIQKYLHEFVETRKHDRCAICGGEKKEHYDEKDNQYINEEEIAFKNRTTHNNTNLKIINSDNNKLFKGLTLKDINIPQSLIDDFDDENICRICFDTKMDGHNSIRFECGHTFCKICIRSYLKNKIVNGKVNL